jgi:3-oxoacyl-[acyl-carrier protein] reductase
MPHLDGKIALISGSGRGIGREIALKLASAGAYVVVNDLDAAPATQTVEDIAAAGGTAVAVVGSVTDDDFADRFVTSAVDTFGGIDIVINNAGYTWDTVIQKMTDEQWDAIVDVHLRAPFRILRAVQPVIASAVKKAREAGKPVPGRKVVNISSIAGLGGNAGQVNYAAAKAGVAGMTRALAREIGSRGITVNCVAPGFIDTDMTKTLPEEQQTALKAQIPLGRLGSPEDIAHAVAFLASPQAGYITGTTMHVNGGMYMS